MSDTITLVLPADLKYLNIVGACVEALLQRVEKVTDRSATVYNIQLALQEACTNVVTHAYQGGDATQQITLAFNVFGTPTRLVAQITDQGIQFDPDTVAAPNLDEPQVHGYGLFLIRELMDQVEYQVDANGNHLTLTKVLEYEPNGN